MKSRKWGVFQTKWWFKWSSCLRIEQWHAMARWWRKSLDVFSFPYLFVDIQFSWLDLYPYSSLPKPPVFVIRVPFFHTVYNVLNVNFKISGCNILQKSVILPAMRGLPTTMQRDMGKVGFFDFSLGNLEHFVFFGMLTLRLFSCPGGDQAIYPCLRTIYWLAGCLRSDFGAGAKVP